MHVFIDTLTERNKVFAARQSAGSLMPLADALLNVKALVIGCADMRVDPANVLGIAAGEAVVMRNIGGRVTPGLLEQLGMLGRIGEVAGVVPGGGGEFNAIVLQHTDCGMTRLADSPAMVARYFGVSDEALPAKSIMDPRRAVAIDIDALRAAHALPAAWLLSGLVYDVATGTVEIIVPPAPVGDSALASVR